MLLEADTKAVPKTFRPALLDVAQRGANAGQHGGFPKQTLSMVSMRVKAHLLRLRNKGANGGVLFLASRAAYYSVIRDILVPSTGVKFGHVSLEDRACELFQEQAAGKIVVQGLEKGGLLAEARACSYEICYGTNQWYMVCHG